MKRLQSLYWHSQAIHDQLAAIEHRMRKLSNQGKSCTKTQSKYIELLDELRDVNALMLMEEQPDISSSGLLRGGDSILITCV